MTQQQEPQSKPVDLGVSQKALSLAREVDRLKPGTYNLSIEKQTHAEGGGMRVVINQIVVMSHKEIK